MKPTLSYLLLTRSILQDTVNSEPSAIGIYDTLYIMKDRNELAYPLSLVGRLYLNASGTIPVVQVKLKLTDPDGIEVGDGQLLTGENIRADLGMNLLCRSWPLVFTKTGKYRIDVSVSTDGTTYTELDSPTYFQVVKMT